MTLNDRTGTTATVFLLLCSAALNCFQASYIKQLRAVADPSINWLKEGDRFPKLDVVRQLGTSSQKATSRTRLVYWFSPHCVWCARNLPGLSSLVEQLQGRYDIIGIVKDQKGLDQYIIDREFTFPIHVISAADKGSIGFGGTPATMVVNEAGGIVRVFRGAYSESVGKAVEEYFSIQLPKLDIPKMPRVARAK